MNDINSVKPAPLPVWETIRDAFIITWQRKRQFLRVLILPILLLMMVEHVHIEAWSPIVGVEIWPLLPLYFVIIMLLALSCHRVVLISDDEVSILHRLGILPWSWREIRFLGWGLLVSLYTYILFPMAALAFILVVYFLPENILDSVKAFPIFRMLIFSHIPMLTTLLCISYLVARWSLILPATAVDKRLTLSEAWNLATGNGWRLTIIVGILPFCFGMLGLFFFHDNDSTILSITISIISYLLLTVEITALSLAYKFLSKFPTKQEAAITLF